eukprot:COSAG05_NODE_18225_length_311_cov_1.466981_1_plen_45_part_10
MLRRKIVIAAKLAHPISRSHFDIPAAASHAVCDLVMRVVMRMMMR